MTIRVNDVIIRRSAGRNDSAVSSSSVWTVRENVCPPPGAGVLVNAGSPWAPAKGANARQASPASAARSAGGRSRNRLEMNSGTGGQWAAGIYASRQGFHLAAGSRWLDTSLSERPEFCKWHIAERANLPVALPADGFESRFRRGFAEDVIPASGAPQHALREAHTRSAAASGCSGGRPITVGESS